MAARMTTASKRRVIWRDVVAGLVGGLVASWVMNQFQAWLSQVGSASQPSGGEDEDATRKLAQKLARNTIDRPLSKEELAVAGPVVHYSYGTLMGGVYGALAERSGAVRSLGGVTYGTLLWAAGDEVAVPLFGLSRPSAEFPPSTHAQALAAHVVYGMTTEIVRRGVLAVVGHNGSDLPPEGSRR